MLRESSRIVYGLVVFLVLATVLLAVRVVAILVARESDGQPISLDTKLTGPMSARVLSPDGQVYFDANGSTLRAYLVSTGEIHWSGQFGGKQLALDCREIDRRGRGTGRVTDRYEVIAVAPSSNSTQVRIYQFDLLYDADGGRTKITGRPIGDVRGHRIDTSADHGEATRVLFRPGANEFVVFFEKGQVRRFTLDAESRVRPVRWFETAAARDRGLSPADSIKLHAGEVTDARFSDGGGFLVTVNKRSDRFVRVLRFGDESLTRTTPHEDEMSYRSAAIRPDGSLLAAARGDGAIELHRREGERWVLDRILSGPSEDASAGMAFRPGTDELFAAGHDNLWLWDIPRGSIARRFPIDGDEQILCWRTVEEGTGRRKLLAVDSDGQIQRWDYRSEAGRARLGLGGTAVVAAIVILLVVLTWIFVPSPAVAPRPATAGR